MEAKQLTAAERIAIANAKRQEVQDRIARKAREEAELANAEKAERELEESIKLEELIDKHGPLGKAIRVINTPDGAMVVVKKATYRVWQRYQSKAGFDDRNVKAQEELAEACVVYPSQAEYIELREKYPMLTASTAGAVAALSQVMQEEVQGK